MAKAAEPGHSDVVSQLQNTEKQDERDDITTMKAAATNGKIELVALVQWITEMAHPHGFLAAASHGHVELLESMTEQYAIGASTTLGSLVKAAENGLLHVERWLIERDWNDEDLDSDSDNDDWDEYGYGYDWGGRRQESPRPTHATNLGVEACLAIHAAATISMAILKLPSTSALASMHL